MRTDILLVTPRNDEESLQILKIAEKLNIPHLVSKQPHGARLHNEPELVDQILTATQQDLAIVENPSLEAEDQLQKAGKSVHIIDHHRYDDLNRMKPESSLEQFLALFEITEGDLENGGFDNDLVQAVGALDRGFVWELRKVGYAGDRYQKALEYYQALGREVDGETWDIETEAAAKSYAERRTEGDYLVVEQEEDRPSIREAISFLIAADYEKEPPQAIIRQGKARIYLQDSKSATMLHEKFGGFTFGQDLCWGIDARQTDHVPSVEEVLAALRSEG